MMAEKARMFQDEKSLKEIMLTQDPYRQKMIGRSVEGFDKDIWNANAKQIVYRGNYSKFTQNDDLLEVLMATRGTTLVEASPYDKIWGIGRSKTDPLAHDRSKWKGTNWLGEVLTKLREDLYEARTRLTQDN